jgi:hypothetical protein
MEWNILSHSTHHTTGHKVTHRFFFLFFSLSRKPVFTGTLAILGCIHRFSNSNKTFSQKLNTDSESAQKTESNEVSFKLIWQLSFFLIFQGVVEELKLLYISQKMKVVKLTWKILHSTQFFVLILNLYLVCD